MPQTASHRTSTRPERRPERPPWRRARHRRGTGLPAAALPVAALAAATTLLAAPAQGAIVDERFEQFDLAPMPQTCTAPDGSTYDLALRLQVEQTTRFKAHRPGSDEVFIEQRYTDRLTWTNTTTGTTFSAVRDAMIKDTALVETLDDGLYVVLTVSSGRTTFSDEDGRRVEVQTGVEHLRTTLDSQGTPDPWDDTFVGDELLRGAGNPAQSVCDVANRLTLG